MDPLNLFWIGHQLVDLVLQGPVEELSWFKWLLNLSVRFKLSRWGLSWLDVLLALVELGPGGLFQISEIVLI